MSENSTGQHLLAEKDFVDVVNEAGDVVGSVPKHWGAEQLAPGLKKKSKGSRSSSASTSSSSSSGPVEPAGNASTEDWAAYARTKGATDEDLKDGQGEPLGRDEIRAKYGTPASS